MTDSKHDLFQAPANVGVYGLEFANISIITNIEEYIEPLLDGCSNTREFSTMIIFGATRTYSKRYFTN